MTVPFLSIFSFSRNSKPRFCAPTGLSDSSLLMTESDVKEAHQPGESTQPCCRCSWPGKTNAQTLRLNDEHNSKDGRCVRSFVLFVSIYCLHGGGQRSELATLRRTLDQTTEAAKSRDRENAQVRGSPSGSMVTSNKAHVWQQKTHPAPCMHGQKHNNSQPLHEGQKLTEIPFHYAKK